MDDVSGICLTPVSTPSLHTSLLRPPPHPYKLSKSSSFLHFSGAKQFHLPLRNLAIALCSCYSGKSFVCAVTKKVHGNHPGFWAIVRFWSNNEWRSKWYTTQQGDSYTSCPAKKLIWLCQEILNKMQWPIRIKASFKTSGQKMKTLQQGRKPVQT